MSNRLLTSDEVTEKIAKPMLAAFREGLVEVYEEARVAFDNGETEYRTIYFGFDLTLKPEDLPQ